MYIAFQLTHILKVFLYIFSIDNKYKTLQNVLSCITIKYPDGEFVKS